MELKLLNVALPELSVTWNSVTRACRYSSLPSSIPLLPNELGGREPGALLSPSLSAGGYRPGQHTQTGRGRDDPGAGDEASPHPAEPCRGPPQKGWAGRARPPFCGRRCPQAAAAILWASLSSSGGRGSSSLAGLGVSGLESDGNVLLVDNCN